MRAAYKTQISRFEGRLTLIVLGAILFTFAQDAKQKVSPDATSSDPLVQHAYIASHLKTCSAAIGTSQADNIAGMNLFFFSWLYLD